jgi:DNA-binding SARP family transcriptional activator/pimeloyl-ACP methyl ester carboxylesterase
LRAGQRAAIRLIGLFEIETPDGTVTGETLRGRAATLVKRLALAPNHALHRDELIELLWPDSDAERGRNNLHKALHTLRRTIAGDGSCDLVALHDAMVILTPECAVDLDQFERAAAAARADGTVDALERALALVRGDLLPADLYDDWAAPARSSFHTTVGGLRLALAAGYADQGRALPAEDQLRAVLALDPCDERAHRALMRQYFDAGDSTRAIRQYETCVRALADLDAVASVETAALFDEINGAASPFDFAAGSTCPRIEYTRTADGVRIGYQSFGRGRPLVHMASIPWNSLELEWQVPAWRAWYQQLAEGRTLVRYDNRGQGVSDRRHTQITVDTTVLDVTAVVDELGLQTFDLYAPLHASLGAIAFASAQPERVRRMVLFGGYSRGRDYRDLAFVDSGTALAQDDWQMFCGLLASNAFAMQREEVIRGVTSVFINSSSPELQAGAVADYFPTDVTDRLRAITAPVLLIQPGPAAGWLPQTVAEKLVADLPNGRLVELDVPVVPITGDVEAVIDTIHTFFDAPE